MDSRSDLIVVSAFGRGNWLAAEMARKGLSTVLVDVSEALGHWAPEDWEGPFGFFQSDWITESQLTRLNEEDYMDSESDGFVLWLSDGVVDTAGPVSSHRLEKRGVTEAQRKYISQFENLKPEDRLKMRREFQALSFHENWFTQFSHSFAANSFSENSAAMNSSRPLPLFSPHNIRRTSRRGYDQNLKWVESWGAKVLKAKSIKDLSSNSGFIQGLEIESDWSGVISAEQYIWSLSGVESLHLSPSITSSLFPQVIWPSWQWQRYRMKFEGADVWQSLPSHLVAIEDLGLPWTHENFLVVQKSVNPGDSDVWMRLPHSQRFHREYLLDKSRAATEILQSRLPGVKVSVQNFPQEYEYDEKDLGPARFPLFDQVQASKYKTGSWINLHYDGPEVWELLDWSSVFHHQSKIAKEISGWKKDRDERREKEVQP